jgi:hypothetical protein
VAAASRLVRGGCRRHHDKYRRELWARGARPIIREKSLTGSMYDSSEPHAMTEPLLDYLAGARLQPPRSLTGARFPLDLINDAVGSAVTGGRGRVLVMTGC